MPAALVEPININNVHFMLSKKTVTADDIAAINSSVSYTHLTLPTNREV